MTWLAPVHARRLSTTVSWWVCSAAFCLPLSMTVADAQRRPEAAWAVHRLDGSAPARESRPDILDTPVMPGSVVKTATLVAALEAGVITPESARMCRRTVTVGGRRYVCSHPDLKRPLTPSEALAHSCNDFFVSLAQRLPVSAFNAVRQRVGLPPITGAYDYAATLVGLDGPRVSPRTLLDAVVRLVASSERTPSQATQVLREGLLGAARFGSASELASRGLPALAKTGTASMPGGGVLGLAVVLVPPDAPHTAAIVVAPGAAGRDAVSLLADLLQADGDRVRVGVTTAGGGVRVETLDREEYVARVVAGETASSAPPAAQGALAIVARTFVAAHRRRHAGEGFDVCDLTHCQVLRPATASARRAAAATRGTVLLDGATPAEVYYSAWCGGHSERPSQVWPGASDRPFNRFGPDDACGAEASWSSDVAVRDIELALRAVGVRGTQLRDLRVVERSRSGRVVRLHVAGFAPAQISAEDFRLALGRTAGWQLLKSTMFELQRTGTGYRFIGRGAGHGVGMCVLGAGRRAAAGATAAEILRFYYPGLTMRESAGRAATDVEVALPTAESSERERLIALVREARDQTATRSGVTPPPTIRITVYPEPASFTRATRLPWWTAAATSGHAISLLPLSVLRERGQLERTIRHEVAHVLLDEALADRPLWVREGAAIHFSSGEPPVQEVSRACPSDDELRTVASAEAQRDAYVRAAACFRSKLATVRSWRDVR